MFDAKKYNAKCILQLPCSRHKAYDKRVLDVERFASLNTNQIGGNEHEEDLGGGTGTGTYDGL